MSIQSTINPEFLKAANSVGTSQHTPTTQSHPVDRSRKSSWLERCLTAGTLVCFALAGWHFAMNPTSEASVVEHGRLGLDPASPQSWVETQPTESSTSEKQLGTTSIHDIRLGQRVVGKNPLRNETQAPSEITLDAWR